VSGATIAGKAAWLDDPDLQRLLEALSTDGEQARIAGAPCETFC
jgi:poly(A) polymerase/tRNA nucleotidyltransferase (CCA-adding enzyme)